MTTHIGVVVVAYNSATTIGACVQSILSQSEVSELIVVDNSPDDRVRFILPDDPRTHYLHRPDNPGFATGCNIGASMLSGHTHIAFVNPDVVLVRPLAELADTERISPFAVIAGGLSSKYDAPPGNARVAATIGRELMKAVSGSRSLIVGNLPAGRCVQVPQLDGALLVLAVDTFARIGGFDERFELYYEDVDLCRAAATFGGCALVTDLYGLHAGGASSRTIRTRAYIAGRVSRVRYFRKWGRRPRAANAGLWLVASVELIARTLARTDEGLAARRSAYLAQMHELARPGSVSSLSRDTVTAGGTN